MLSMHADDYVTIGGNVIVQLFRVTGTRAVLAVDASKEIPIVRGKVLERKGEPKPSCLIPPVRRVAKQSSNMLFRWSMDRERAVQKIYDVCEQLEKKGSGSEAEALRVQLEHIIPAIWEEKAEAQ